jgi:hypothetical protein
MFTTQLRRSRSTTPFILTALMALTAGLGSAAAHGPIVGVQPPVVSAVLTPGSSLTVDKIVHTPAGTGPVTITPQVVFCSSGLSVSISPPSITVQAGDDAVFVETISVAPNAPPGTGFCVVRFLLNGQEAGPEFEQRIFITVEPGGNRCEETTNPHGQTVPPAGSTTLPGPKGGQNEDGFYRVSSADGSPVFVVDTGSGTVFGPFPSGTKIKYTEANGATPSQKKIGSTSGQAGAVSWHITGTGDAAVFSVTDPTLVPCLVPPPPK